MLLNIHPDNPDQRKMAMAVKALQDGEVIVLPTDTVYCFGCDLSHPKAIEVIARLKGVKPEKANLSIICQDLSHLAEFAVQLPNPTFKLMKSLLPGPYTFILPASKNVPRIFSSNKKTIGIRVPDNLIARELVQLLGRPIVCTSVHSEDEMLEYNPDAEEIHEKFGHQVAVVIDG
ncbi:MAG: hypothetical protein RL220_623, partial [Bacteroidota bacterium]